MSLTRSGSRAGRHATGRRGLVLLLLGTLPAATACDSRIHADSPDVILVTVDTLRADRLGFMGYEHARTPTLDALAGRGVVFTQATAPVPRTTPALASLHTGLWPHRHGSREVGDPIASGTTLAERLTASGYWTAGVSANSTAGRKERLAAGFAEFVGTDEIEAGHTIYDVLRGTSPEDSGWADAVTEEALALVGQAPGDRPMLLWTFYFDPHFLYAPPSPWQNEVEADDCWSLYSTGEQDPTIVGRVFNDIDGIGSRALKGCSALYDAEIAYTDDRIGRLLEGVERLRGDRPRLIVFTADHGENLGEGGLFYEHGDNVHDAAIRVPLMFAADGAGSTPIEGRVDELPVSLVDVAPTILGLLGIRTAEPLDGSDLSARLADLTRDARTSGSTAVVDPDRVVFSESAAPMFHESARHQIETGHGWGTICLHGERYSLCQGGGEGERQYTLHDRQADPELQQDVSGLHPEELARLLEARARWPVASPRSLTARGGRFKLVRRPALSGGYRDILVDLRNDLAETVDVAAEHPDEARTMQRALDLWMSEWSPPSPLPPDPELGRRLRALGYIR